MFEFIKNTKGISTLIIIFFIVGILLVVGSVVYYLLNSRVCCLPIQNDINANQNFNGNVNQVSSDWLEYQSSHKGIQVRFEYPSTWRANPTNSSLIEESAIQVIGSAGNQFLLFPTGGYGYGLDEGPTETQTKIEIDKYPALKREFIYPSGFILTRIEFENIPNHPDFRVEFRTENLADKQVLERILNSLKITNWQRKFYENKEYGFTFTYPARFSLNEKDDEINLFDDPLLPPVLAIEVFTPTNVTNAQSSEELEEILKKIAEEKIGAKYITKIVGMHNGGLEVEADTFFHRHFFVFNDIALEFNEGEDGYFANEEFKQIIDSITLPNPF